jgi:hypothetical protein
MSFMIKKNTKIIIEGEDNKKFAALQGGIPLSKGEIINIYNGSKVVCYKVKNKLIDCFLEGDDQIVNMTYVLKKFKSSKYK